MTEISKMTRIQLACSSLLASAFILGGFLLVKLEGHATSNVHADQVIKDRDFTFMTARTGSDEESLFVIDNINARLLILRSDVNRKRIELLDSTNLDRIFTRSGNAAGRGRGRAERAR